MGAPVGNDNVKKGKAWESALKRALARAGGSIDQGLDPAADKVVAAARDGDQKAIEHIADRLDGKPKQVIDHGLSDDPENPVQSLVQASEAIKAKIRGS